MPILKSVSTELGDEPDDDQVVTWWGLVIEGYLATQNRLLTEIDKRFGLAPASFDVLLRLVRSPEHRMPMTRLAREAALSSGGFTKVADRLTVEGHDTVYALGDITDVAETKMAAVAMRHAEVVAANILAHANGDEPDTVYAPFPARVILLPLGPAAGVGQFPNEQGAAFQVPMETVVQMKGADMMLGHFQKLFNV